jgi:Nif-specific regulatory protein
MRPGALGKDIAQAVPAMMGIDVIIFPEEGAAAHGHGFLALAAVEEAEHLALLQALADDFIQLTGADQVRSGLVEQASGGTLFLDEIGDLSPSLQSKLLRVLQEKEFERLGSNRTMKSDVRLIAATNRNLEEAIQRGTFREDLYYRLNVVNIKLLLERSER